MISFATALPVVCVSWDVSKNLELGASYTDVGNPCRPTADLPVVPTGKSYRDVIQETSKFIPDTAQFYRIRLRGVTVVSHEKR
jgi:hypothetical protein